MGDLKIGKAEIGRVGLTIVVDESMDGEEEGRREEGMRMKTKQEEGKNRHERCNWRMISQ